MRRRVGPLCFLCLRVRLPPTSADRDLSDGNLADDGRTLRENTSAFPLDGWWIVLTAVGLALGSADKEGEAGLDTGRDDCGRRISGGRRCDGSCAIGGGGGLYL